MPTNRKVYGIVILDGIVHNTPLIVNIDDDKNMLELIKQIASEYPHIPAYRAFIWLVRHSALSCRCTLLNLPLQPNKLLPLGYSAPEDLRARLAGRKLSDIAKRAEFEQTVEAIVDISTRQPGVQVKKTHIVIEIPPTTRTRSISSDEEAELEDFVGVLAKSVSIFLL